MASKLTIGGICLLVFGLIVAVVWTFAFYPIFDPVVEKKLKEALIVDSPQAIGYYDWEQGTAQRNWNYYVYYMWNMTNSADVLGNGDKPEYEQLGPYCYRYYWYNKNATFSDGGNKVEYSLLEDYIFVPSLSKGDPTKDVITNINPAYLGVLVQAGGESHMLLGAVNPQIILWLQFLTGEYLDIVSSQYVPEQLIMAKQVLITQLSNYTDIDPEVYFYEQWSNAIDEPDKGTAWPGMLVGKTNGQPLNVSLDTARLLFSEEATYSLVSSNAEDIMMWYHASLQQTDAIDTLSETFNISSSQVTMIALWRNSSFIPTYVKPNISSMANELYPGAIWTDVGWIQYFYCSFTQPSFSDVYRQWYPDYFEAFEIYPYVSDLSISELMYLFRGPYGILDLQQYTDFLNAAATGDYSRWNLTKSKGQEVFFTYIAEMTQDYMMPFVHTLVTSGSGLITSKTVDDWLWRCFDPLVAFLAGPANASCVLQFNHTYQPRSEIWTGKDDLKKLNKFTKWREMTEIYLWNEPVPIEGCAENGVFPPKITKGESLKVWDESFYQTVTLNQHEKTSINDIGVYKYIMDLGTFNASILYTNTIPGFANESAANQGVPVFLSNWDLYGVPGEYGNASNMKPNASDVTTLLIEPITGNTLKADMKVQVNFLFPDGGSDWIDTYTDDFGKVPDDTFYPVLKVWQKSEVGTEDTKKLQKQLKVFDKSFQNGVRFGVAGAGAFLLIVGVVMIVVGQRRRGRDGYMDIQGFDKRSF